MAAVRRHLGRLIIGVTVILSAGCATSTGSRAVARLNQTIEPRAAVSTELAAAFGLDEYGLPESLLASASDD